MTDYERQSWQARTPDRLYNAACDVSDWTLRVSRDHISDVVRKGETSIAMTLGLAACREALARGEVISGLLAVIRDLHDYTQACGSTTQRQRALAAYEAAAAALKRHET
jgi:hypothetical protein